MCSNLRFYDYFLELAFHFIMQKTLQRVLGSKMNEWMQIQNRGSKQRKVIGAETALQTKGIKDFLLKKQYFYILKNKDKLHYSRCLWNFLFFWLGCALSMKTLYLISKKSTFLHMIRNSMESSKRYLSILNWCFIKGKIGNFT